MTGYNEPTTEFIDMVDGLLEQLPQCPTAVAEQAMRKAVRDFYQATWVWTSVLPQQITQEGFKTYPVNAPYEAAILGLERIEYDSNSGNLPDWVFEPPRNLRFLSDPQPDVAINPVAVLQPSAWATGVPADHPSMWLDTWEHGCLFYLRQQPQTPWYSPNDAQAQYREFKRGIAYVRAQMGRGHRSGARSINPKPLA